MPMTEAQLEEFLTQPHLAVLSTVDAEGRPRSAPVWFQWEDGAAYVFTGRGSLNWRNLERNPAASLCIERRTVPYAAAILDGDIEEADQSRLHEFVLAMATRYYGDERGREFAREYLGPRPQTVLFRLRPRRITSWDYAAEGD